MPRRSYRGLHRAGALALGAIVLGALAIPLHPANAQRAKLLAVDFGGPSLSPTLLSARASRPFLPSALLWPGPARLPVVMP
jgi:hypothetical protein